MIRLTTIISVLLLTTLAASANVLDEWSADLGASPEAKLSYLFEVTFMKIDVATVMARLDDETTQALAAIVSEGKRSDERTNRASDALLAADTIAFGMEFRRDGEFDRFLKGVLNNLEKAMEADIVTAEEHARIRDAFEALMLPHQERGAFQGDRLLFRVQADGVRVIYLGFDDQVLVDSFEAGGDWARGIKGVFAGEKSKLRKKLVERVWD